MRILHVLLCCSIIALVCIASHSRSLSSDAATVTATMDRAAIIAVIKIKAPDYVVDKVKIAADWALVEWQHGEGGGQGLLRKKNGKWVCLGIGGGVLDEGVLRQMGVPTRVQKQFMTQSH